MFFCVDSCFWKGFEKLCGRKFEFGVGFRKFDFLSDYGVFGFGVFFSEIGAL
jgi:hypothetical protein